MKLQRSANLHVLLWRSFVESKRRSPHLVPVPKIKRATCRQRQTKAVLEQLNRSGLRTSGRVERVNDLLHQPNNSVTAGRNPTLQGAGRSAQ